MRPVRRPALQGIAYFATQRPGAFGPPGALPELTSREREVLELVAQGRNNPGIAQRLYLSVPSVRSHVSNIFTKLAVADRAHFIVLAREAGIAERRRR